MKSTKWFTLMLLLLQCFVATAQRKSATDAREKLLKDVAATEKRRSVIMDSIYAVSAIGADDIKMLPIFERNLRIWSGNLQDYEYEILNQRDKRHKTYVYPEMKTSGGVISFSSEHGAPRVPAELDFMPGVNSLPMISRWDWKVTGNSVSVSGTERLNVMTGFDPQTYKAVKPKDPFAVFYTCNGGSRTVNGNIKLKSLPNNEGGYDVYNLPCKVTVSCSHSNYYVVQTAVVTGSDDLYNMMSDPENHSGAMDSRDFFVTDVRGKKHAVDGDYNPYCFTHRTTHNFNLADVAKQSGITMDSLSTLLATTYIEQIDLLPGYQGAEPLRLSSFEKLVFNTIYLKKKYPAADTPQGLSESINNAYGKIAEMHKLAGGAKRVLTSCDKKLVKLYSALVDSTWSVLDRMPYDAYKGNDYEIEVNRYKAYCAALQRSVKNVGTPTEDMKAKFAENNRKEKVLDAVLKLRNGEGNLDFFASVSDNECKRHYATKIFQTAIDSVATLVKEQYLLNAKQKKYFARYFPLMDYIWEISRDTYYSKGVDIEPQVKFSIDVRRKLDLFDIATGRANDSYNRFRKYASKEEEVAAQNAKLAYELIKRRWWGHDKSDRLGEDFDMLYIITVQYMPSKIDKDFLPWYQNSFATLNALDSERMKKSPVAKLIFGDILYDGDNKDFYKVPKKVKKQALDADDWHILYDHCINMGKSFFAE